MLWVDFGDCEGFGVDDKWIASIFFTYNHVQSLMHFNTQSYCFALTDNFKQCNKGLLNYWVLKEWHTNNAIGNTIKVDCDTLGDT